MKSSEVVQVFKAAIESTKRHGIEKVSIEDLEAYAARLEEAVKESPSIGLLPEIMPELLVLRDLNAWAGAAGFGLRNNSYISLQWHPEITSRPERRMQITNQYKHICGNRYQSTFLRSIL